MIGQKLREAVASRETSLLGLVLTAALAVRLLGVGRGLPYMHEWDEPTVLSYVIGMMQRGDLYPNAFVYPSVYYYMLLPVMYLHYFYLHARGALATPWDINLFHPQASGSAYWWYISVPSFYLWGRVLTSLVGTATVYLVYRLGRAVYGAPAGLLGAAFLAFAPGAVYYSDTVRVDIPMTFFVTLTLLTGLAVLRRGTVRDYAVTGLLAGVAISTKTNAVVVGLPLALAHLLNTQRKHLITAPLVLMGACALAGFALGTPYVLIRSQMVLQQFRDQALAYGGIPSLHLMKTILPRYLAYFVRPSQGDEWFVVPHAAIGLLPAIAALTGAIVGYRSAPREHVYLVSFPVVYILFMSGQRLTTLRNMMAALPVIALLAGVACVWAWRLVLSRWPTGHVRLAPAFAGLAVVTLLAAPARDSIRLGWTLGFRPDTRTAAVDWLRRHMAPGSRIAFEEDLRWFIPGLDRLPYTTLFAPRDADVAWYLKNRVAVAVVGDRSPLDRLPPLAVIPRPPYVYTADSWALDTYPVIDPKIYIVRPKPQEVNAVFPVQLEAGDMVPDPVSKQAVGAYGQTIHLPDQRFTPGPYTISVAGAWPWLWAPPTYQLYIEIQVGRLIVASHTVGGLEPLNFTTPPFRIEQAATLPVQLHVTLRTPRRDTHAGWALRPSPTCATVSDAPSLNVQQLTAEAWLYLESMHEPPGMHTMAGLESEGPILSKRDNNGYTLRLSGDSNNKIWVDLSVAGRWGAGRAGFVPFRKWTHLAATYDGHKTAIYINGSPAIQDTGRTPNYEGTIQSEGAPLAIGCRDPRASDQVSFTGLITGVRLWDRVLRPDEIHDEANIQRLPDKSPGLVGSWTFQATTGDQILDLSPAKNNIGNALQLKRVPIEGGTPALPSWTAGELNLIETVAIRRATP
ncbi:MAG TPA: LamG-like jellyroll fold domain-containing protein [bacterium]|nr:LamG-like jellyroll fold domain-containing protein [bacterium]